MFMPVIVYTYCFSTMTFILFYSQFQPIVKIGIPFFKKLLFVFYGLLKAEKINVDCRVGSLEIGWITILNP